MNGGANGSGTGSKRFTLADLNPEMMAGEVERRRVTGEQLELIVYDYPAGARFAEHHHEAEQLTIVLEGALVFLTPRGEERLEAGDALLIVSNEPHGAYVPDGVGATKTINLFSPVRNRLPSGL